jgi:hypothetical protein
MHCALHFCYKLSEVRDNALPVHLEKPNVSALPQLKHTPILVMCLATFWSAMENFTGCNNLRTMQIRKTRAKVWSPQNILKPRNIMAVSWFRRLVTGLLPRGLGFYTRPEDKLPLKQVYVRVLLGFTVPSILPMIHIHSFINYRHIQH